MIRKIKTSLTAKLFLATTVLFDFGYVCFLFSVMARYIPKLIAIDLSAELQKQANDLDASNWKRLGSLEE